MRLMKRFLRDIGSRYKPENVVNINNKRFSSTLEPPAEIPEQVYTGTYLGGRTSNALSPVAYCSKD